MFWTNYHSHCHYCDGKESPEAYVRSAVNAGMKAYGFSSHGPIPFESRWNMKPGMLHSYIDEIRSLKRKYHEDIEIYLSLEMDYIPGMAGPSHYKKMYDGFDYSLCSVHYVDFLPGGQPWEIDGSHEHFRLGIDRIFGGDTRKAVERYYALMREMLMLETPDILGHLDKIKIQSKGSTLFSETNWYREAIEETLDAVQKAGSMVEVNTRGLYQKKSSETYPGLWILKEMKTRNIPVVLSSDAHLPAEVAASFSVAATALLEAGYEEAMSFLDNRWIPLDIHPDGFSRNLYYLK